MIFILKNESSFLPVAPDGISAALHGALLLAVPPALLQVLLVVVLRRGKLVRLLDFGVDFMPRLFQLRLLFFEALVHNCLLLVIEIVDAGSVLRSFVVPLVVLGRCVVFVPQDL